MFCFRQCLTSPKFSCWIISFKQCSKNASKALLPVEIRSSSRKKCSVFFKSSCRKLAACLHFFALLGCTFLFPPKTPVCFRVAWRQMWPCSGRSLSSCLGKWKNTETPWSCEPVLVQTSLMAWHNRALLLHHQPWRDWMSLRMMR